MLLKYYIFYNFSILSINFKAFISISNVINSFFCYYMTLINKIIWYNNLSHNVRGNHMCHKFYSYNKTHFFFIYLLERYCYIPSKYIIYFFKLKILNHSLCFPFNQKSQRSPHIRANCIFIIKKWTRAWSPNPLPSSRLVFVENPFYLKQG